MRTGGEEGAEDGPREALRAGRVRQAPRAARCVDTLGSTGRRIGRYHVDEQRGMDEYGSG